MEKFCLSLCALLTVSCASVANQTFDHSYSSSEIAALTSEHFDVLEKEAKSALKPAFAKYGAPDAYVDGLMSSIDKADANHLYGSGNFKTKIRLTESTFWRVDGENLQGHFDPVKTAHLVYKTLRLDPLRNHFTFEETLTKRGQTFTVFERLEGDEVIITLHKTGQLPDASLESIRFFDE